MSEYPFTMASFIEVWLELAVAAGVELPDRLEARRRRWRELAVSSGDGTGDGSTVPDPGREEAPGRSRGLAGLRRPF